MSDADNIKNNDGCYIWWNANGGQSEDCDFKEGSSQTVVATMESNGRLDAWRLITRGGVITAEDPPLWIVESSSDGDLVSFRKGSSQKVLIKGNGEIYFDEDKATLSTTNRPINIHNYGSSGNIASFLFDTTEKLAITSGGKIEFKDDATISATDQHVSIQNSGSAGDIASFIKGTSDKLYVRSDGEIHFEDNATISATNQPVSIRNDGSSGEVASFFMGSNELVKIEGPGQITFPTGSASTIKTETSALKVDSHNINTDVCTFLYKSSERLIVSKEGNLTFAGTTESPDNAGDAEIRNESVSEGQSRLISIKSVSSGTDIVKFSHGSDERLRILESGKLRFNQTSDIGQYDDSILNPSVDRFESALHTNIFAGEAQVVLGKGDDTINSKIKEVRIGNGFGTRSNPNGILGIYPEDNGGAISFNKGNLDLAMRGYAGIVGKQQLWFYLGSSSAPVFKMDQNGFITFPINNQSQEFPTSDPSNLEDGAFWFVTNGSNVELRVQSGGNVKSVSLT